MGAVKPDPGGSATLQRALDVLEALAEAEPAGLSAAQAAQRVGINRVTAHRILQTLRQRGYARQDSPGRPYRLGMGLLELGETMLARLDVVEVARPFLAELAEDTQETAHLAVLDGAEAVYVAKVESRRAVRLVSRIGSRVPLYCTALGKALLAAHDGDRRSWLLDRQSLAARTPRTITDRARLERELERTRRRGFAIDSEENEPGVRCVGAAVVDRSGEPVAALSVSGPAYRLQRNLLEPYGELVRATAESVAAQLGRARAVT